MHISAWFRQRKSQRDRWKLLATNWKKKEMVAVWDGEINIPHVDEFKHAVYFLTDEERCVREIPGYIRIEKFIFKKLNKLEINKNISLESKKRFQHCDVISMMKYDRGQWKISIEMKRKLYYEYYRRCICATVTFARKLKHILLISVIWKSHMKSMKTIMRKDVVENLTLAGYNELKKETKNKTVNNIMFLRKGTA